MTTIKRFTPDYKMHAVRFVAFAREAEHGELVGFDAHQQTVSALEAERDAQQKRADALAVCCSLYREAISKARRLINVDEMGDADDVLAQAERELSSHDAALAAIRDAVLDRVIAKLGAMGSPDFTLMAVRALKNELREAK
ncbi:hypothetical protein ACTVKP_25405 [Serratia bockelmannii]|uniref:hypothetical protein n=1 Tax=Serratia bockelmannii TaxID=2703793 RepID=UPI003FA6994C